MALQPEVALLAKNNLDPRHEVLYKRSNPFTGKVRVLYRYNRISQLLEKCFLFIFSLVDVQEVNQKFDRSALFGELLMLGK